MHYCQWTRVEKRDIRVVDVEEPNMNNGNSMDCSDIKISDDAADGLIATDVSAVDLKDFSDDAADGLIFTDINTGNSADCAHNYTGGFISDIDGGDLMDFFGITISDDAAYEFIAVGTGDSTDYEDTNVLGDAVDRLIMLMV